MTKTQERLIESIRATEARREERQEKYKHWAVMYKAGLTLREIGERYKVSRQAIQQQLEKLGTDMRPAGTPKIYPEISVACDECGTFKKVSKNARFAAAKHFFCSAICADAYRIAHKKTPEQLRERDRIRMNRYYHTPEGNKKFREAKRRYVESGKFAKWWERYSKSEAYFKKLKHGKDSVGMKGKYKRVHV